MRLFTPILLAALTTLIVWLILPPRGSVDQAAANQTYARVIATGTIRCGYAPFDPMLKVDPNTKAISGIAYEVMETIARNLGLKVEWVEEVGWGEFVTALEHDRFDAFCTGGWPNSQRARVIAFTNPFAYAQVGIYSRNDDHRFDNNLAAINHPNVRLSLLDGTTVALIAKQEFPNATVVSLPENASLADNFQNIATHKADIGIQDHATVSRIMLNNPGKFKLIPGSLGVRKFPAVFAVQRDEQQLLNMLNVALRELDDAGKLEPIIAAHEPVPGAYRRINTGYRP